MQQKQRSAHSLLQSWKKYLPRRAVVMARKKVQGSFGDCASCGRARAELRVQGPAAGSLAFVTLDSDPFAAETGELLTKMIEALKLKRAEVLVLGLNTSDCTECARGILSSSRSVVAFGLPLARFLLGVELARGECALLRSTRVQVTHALEFLLASPAAKKEAWVDLQAAALS